MSSRRVASKKVSRKRVGTKRARTGRGMSQYNTNLPMTRYPQVEKKYLDWFINQNLGADWTAGAGTGPVMKSDLLACSQGPAFNQRIGKKITLRNVNVRGAITTRTLGSLNRAFFVRVALVLDMQANGTSPTYLDIYSRPSTTANVNVGATGAPNADGLLAPLWLRNMSSVRRFKVLKEKIVHLAPPGAWIESSPEQAVVEKVFKMSWRGAIPIYYSGPDADVAQITSNNLILVAIVDQNTTIASIADSPACSFGTTVRCKYTDL